jgi:hypothetical protein
MRAITRGENGFYIYPYSERGEVCVLPYFVSCYFMAKCVAILRHAILLKKYEAILRHAILLKKYEAILRRAILLKKYEAILLRAILRAKYGQTKSLATSQGKAKEKPRSLRNRP